MIMEILFLGILLNLQLFEAIQNASTSYAGFCSLYTRCFHPYTLLIFLKPADYIFGYHHYALDADGCACVFPSIGGFFQTDRAYSAQEKLSVAAFDFDGWFESLRSQENLQKQQLIFGF